MFGLPELTINAWLRFDGIRRGLLAARPGTVLEIGAGEGGLGAWLASRYEYVGIEQDDLSRATAQARLDRVGRGRLLRELDECGDTRFDLVSAFEVLEHIHDDVKVLLRFREQMQPGGHLLLSVPAHSRRYGPFDELAGHYRRYDRSVIVQRLHDAGFELVRLTSHGTGLGIALEHGRNLFAACATQGDTGGADHGQRSHVAAAWRSRDAGVRDDRGAPACAPGPARGPRRRNGLRGIRSSRALTDARAQDA